MKVLFIILIAVSVLLLLYMLAIMPRITGKPDIKPFAGWMYAHRGLHDNKTDAPENSMKAFQKAVEAGFGIELDIQLSKDNIPVVFHDFTLGRVCGAEGKVCEYTFEELQQFPLYQSQERIPRFEDVLKFVDGRVPLIVEFKIEGKDVSLCPIADALLQKYQGVYCMESFNPLGVLWYRRNRAQVVRGQLSDAFLREDQYNGFLYFWLQHLMLNFLTKPDFVAYNHKYFNALSRKICRVIYGNTAVAWTIRSEEELERAGRHFDLFIFDSFVPDRHSVNEKSGRSRI